MSEPEFLEKMRANFISATPHCRALGMEIDVLDATRVEFRLPFREEWIADPERRLVHPGVVTTLVDMSCGGAVLAHIGRQEPIATLDLRMDYLRHVTDAGDIHCRAECYRLTSNIAFVRALVWQTDPDLPTATSQSAFMRTRHPQPQKVAS